VDHIHPERTYDLTVLPLERIELNPKYLVRALDQKHKERLKSEIKEEGLIEPITVNQNSNGGFEIIAGQHRYYACKELGFTEIDAKVYVNLTEADKMLLGYMSNEARKRPAAGNRYHALYTIFEETKRDLIKGKTTPSEEEIINETYMKSKGKVSEIVRGLVVDRLRNDPESLAYKYELIQNAQVPRKKIVNAISQGKYPLFTAQNVFSALSNLVRQKPVDKEEEEQGKNYREYEYRNVREFFNRLVEEFIEPWISVRNIDSAINFARIHPFDAFTKLVAEMLIQDGYPSSTTKTAPFFHSQQIDWNRLFQKLKPLKDSNIWNYPPIAQQRNVNDILYQLRYLIQNGKFAPA